MKTKQPSVVERKRNLSKLIQNILDGKYEGPPCSQRELSQRTGVSYASINSYAKGGVDPSEIKASTIKKLAKAAGMFEMEFRRRIDGEDFSLKQDSITNVYRQINEFFDTNERWELFKYLSSLLEKGQALSIPTKKEPKANQALIDAMDDRRKALKLSEEIFYGIFLDNFGIDSELWNHIQEDALPDTNQLGMFASILDVSVDEVAELLSNEAD